MVAIHNILHNSESLRWRTSVTNEPHLDDARILVVLLQNCVIRHGQVLQCDNAKASIT